MIDAETVISTIHLRRNDVLSEYVAHTNNITKQVVNLIDIGAFENQSTLSTFDLVQDKIVVYLNLTSDIIIIQSNSLDIVDKALLFSFDGK